MESRYKWKLGSEHKTKLRRGKSENQSPTTNIIKKPKLYNERTTLVDLPPEILEKVFAYLPVGEVYYNVRVVCRRLQDVVDGYIQTGKHAKQNIPSSTKLNTNNQRHPFINCCHKISFF